MGAAAAGAAAAIPGGLTLAGTAAGEATVASEAVTAAPVTAEIAGGPVVAQVLDAGSGTVAVYHGTNEVVLQDHGLAQALVKAFK
jgi:hypothetical protein